jgi:hypothetical protein
VSPDDLNDAIGYALSCRAHLAKALRCAALGVERGSFRITDRVIGLLRQAIEEMARPPRRDEPPNQTQ